MASSCASRAGRRHRDARAPSACFRGEPSSLRNTSKPFAICARCARGFAVATLDWRGQGLSQRSLRNSRKGYVRSFDEYAIDLDTFINEVVLPDCPPPHFALAHSMGATILLRAAHNGNRTFDRTVLLAPMIALPGLRRTRTTRIIVRAMRLAGLGVSYVPGG